MKITINSQIIIEEPSKEIKDYCKNNLVMNNPKLIVLKKMGKYIENKPKVIKMYYVNGNKYILPLGCLDDIYKLHNDLKDYKIEFKQHEKLKFPESNITPYPYQEKAIEYMIKAKRGILVAKCR